MKTTYYPHHLAVPLTVAAPLAQPAPADEADAGRTFTSARLAGMTEALDALHTAASEGRLHQLSAVSRKDLKAWLEEMAFLVEETLDEMNEGERAPADEPALHSDDDASAHPAVTLRLVRKSS